MKTHLLDFILSGLALGAMVALALLGTTFLAKPLSIRWLGEYHVVFDGGVFLLSFGLVAALLTRLLLAAMPLKAGEYSMDEGVFTYWKLLTVIYEFGRGALLPFTTVFARPLIAVLFGAKVGSNAVLGGRIADPSLVAVGEGAVLRHNSVVTPHAITSGRIILRDVKIGRGATVGVNVVVLAGVEIGEGSVITAGSVLPPFTKVPPGELWGGIPARKIKNLEATDPRG